MLDARITMIVLINSVQISGLFEHLKNFREYAKSTHTFYAHQSRTECKNENESHGLGNAISAIQWQIFINVPSFLWPTTMFICDSVTSLKYMRALVGYTSWTNLKNCLSEIRSNSCWISSNLQFITYSEILRVLDMIASFICTPSDIETSIHVAAWLTKFPFLT